MSEQPGKPDESSERPNAGGESTPGGDGAPNDSPRNESDGGSNGGSAYERTAKRGWFTRFLDVVEWLGNCLPHPVTLFAIFALAIVLISGLGDYFNLDVADPRPEGFEGRAEDGMIRVQSLMSGSGLRWIVNNLVENFVSFTPLGTVLVALLGVGVAERSGLLGAAIRSIILGAPKNLITFAIVFAGVLSNTASEMGYVVIIPLAAAIFYSLGRHPFAGLAAAFAGVSGGYSANLLIGTVDPLLAGLTEEAARMIDPEYRVHAAVNWYFMVISTFLVTGVGTWVTARIVEPKLGPYDDSKADETVGEDMSMEPLTTYEKRALGWAAAAALGMAALFVYFAGPHFSDKHFLADDVTVSEVHEWDQSTVDEAARRGAIIHGYTIGLAEYEAHQRSIADSEADSEADATDPADSTDGPDDESGNEDAVEEAAGADIDGVVMFPTAVGPTRTVMLPLPVDEGDEAVEFVVPIKTGLRGTVNDVLLNIPGYGVLRNPDTGELLNSPFLNGIVALIFVFFFVPGVAYGIAVGTVRNDEHVINFMAAAMSSMGLYIVLVFFAAQFVSFFGHTNLGSILAVHGANLIQAMGLDNPLVFIPFILMCCFVNLMLGSASAQWAVTAPIFVPMLMLTGYSPEVIQAAYRIGDSTTNIITPMMSYFGMIFAFACRYDRKLGIGTLIATMLPYSICMLLGWIALFYIWVFAFGMPVGPEAPTYYPAP